ncbi:amidohydrolase, partial [Pseudoalteromonas ruthenica]
IDPHTHSLSELTDPTKNANVNYLTQGVTTVVNGNDGGGTHQIDKLKHTLQAQGIGTNVAFFVGHGSVRKAVMGKAKRTATDIEIKKMQALVKKAMQSGALGFSSGLY